MKVKVTKEFLWAGETGNHVRTVNAGDVVEGRAAEVALQLKSGEEVSETQARPPEPSKGK
jgi:hypothetical protein